MPNVLEVQIVGDVSALEKSLKQAEKLQADYTTSIEKTSSELKDSINITNGYKKAIEDLNNAYKSGSISSKDYSKQLANLKRDEKESTVVTANLRKELSNLKREQKEVGGSFDTAAKKTVNGGNALMQFSRIAQDAPFGIMGIGNNITATAEAFGHLQKQTGSTGAALKAVAGSMLGSGGILLAVSLVTTGLTYMAQNGITVSDVFKKLTGTFDESSKRLSELNAEATESAAAQAANVGAYVSAAQNINLSMEDRLIAVQKLQEEYPAYFGNLTKEQILNGDVAGAVKEVTAALIAKAKAAAFTGRITELAKQEFELQQKEVEVLKDIAKQRKEIALSQATRNASGGFGQGANNIAIGEANDALISHQNTLKETQKELRNNWKERDILTEKINENVAASLKLEKVTKSGGGTTSEKEIPVKAKIIPFDGSKLKPADLVTGEIPEITIPAIVLPPVQDDAYLASLERALQAADIFSQGTTSAVNALGSQLASSLETGNAALDAFTGSVIQSFTDIAAAQLAGLIAKQSVATGTIATDSAVSTANAVTAATETAAASGPAAAFVLPALVGAAIGFIAASFAGIKFAHGGIVPGGSFTGDKIPAMLNSGEAVMNSQQQANTLMAIANGNSNALQGNRKSSTFNLETKLRGSDILLALKREEKK